MSIVEEQFADLKRRYPDSTSVSLADGSTLIKVSGLQLTAAKWNKPHVTVWFLAPNGFPVAKPDCFWADPELRLATGALPKNSGLQNPPFGGEPKLWFSWHVNPWNPNRHTLSSYLGVIVSRLATGE